MFYRVKTKPVFRKSLRQCADKVRSLSCSSRVTDDAEQTTIKRNEYMSDIEIEDEIVMMLAEQRWKLQQQLADIDAQLKKHLHTFYVADDGLVEIGLGVF